MAQPVTPQRVIDGAELLLRRLTRNLDAFDGGDASAAGDLAGIISTLTGDGAGNKVVLRLASVARVPLPRELVSGKPETNVPSMIGSFGNLPVAAGQGVLMRQGNSAHSVPFRDWISMPSLIVPASPENKVLWMKFANVVGNARGSHLSQTLPDLLVKSEMFGGAGLSLEDYLVRQLAWQLERILAEVLVSAGATVSVPRDRPVEFSGAALGWACPERTAAPA
jgi:hypothetical protein